jgi:hypothetical protein
VSHVTDTTPENKHWYGRWLHSSRTGECSFSLFLRGLQPMVHDEAIAGMMLGLKFEYALHAWMRH